MDTKTRPKAPAKTYRGGQKISISRACETKLGCVLSFLENAMTGNPLLLLVNGTRNTWLLLVNRMTRGIPVVPSLWLLRGEFTHLEARSPKAVGNLGSKLGNSCVTWRKLLKKSVWFYFVSNYNHMCKVIQQYLPVLWSYEMLFSNGWVFSYNVRIVDLNQRLRNSFQAYFLALKLKEDWMFWSHFVLWFIGVRIFDGTETWGLFV